MNSTTISTASWKTSNHQNHQAAVKSLGANGPTRSQCPSAQGLVAILCFCIMGRRWFVNGSSIQCTLETKRVSCMGELAFTGWGCNSKTARSIMLCQVQLHYNPRGSTAPPCEADWYHIKMKDPKHALLPGVFVKRIFETCQTQVKFFDVKFSGDLRRNLTEI